MGPNLTYDFCYQLYAYAVLNILCSHKLTKLRKSQHDKFAIISATKSLIFADEKKIFLNRFYSEFAVDDESRALYSKWINFQFLIEMVFNIENTGCEYVNGTLFHRWQYRMKCKQERGKKKSSVNVREVIINHSHQWIAEEIIFRLIDGNWFLHCLNIPQRDNPFIEALCPNTRLR